MPQISPMSWTIIFWSTISSFIIYMSLVEKFNSKNKFSNKSKSMKNQWHW